MRYILYIFMAFFSPAKVSDACNKAQDANELDELLSLR